MHRAHHHARPEGAPQDVGEVGVDVDDLAAGEVSPVVRYSVEPASSQSGEPDRASEDSQGVVTYQWSAGHQVPSQCVLVQVRLRPGEAGHHWPGGEAPDKLSLDLRPVQQTDVTRARQVASLVIT